MTAWSAERYAQIVSSRLEEQAQEFHVPLNITLNGDPFEIAGPLTLNALLAQLGIDPRRVAIEHNLVVLKRGMYEQTQVNEGDRIEIVNFVGGGRQ